MSSIESIELWSAAKIIGRECATVNKEYLLCKKHEGKNPSPCLEKSKLVTACAADIVTTVTTKFPTEFKALQKCLDYHDYRFCDCKTEQQSLYAAWNNYKQYK